MEDEIKKITDKVNSLSGVEKIFGADAKRLVAIYNSDVRFHKGKKESIHCRPCVERVIFFFNGFVTGLNFIEK